MKMTLEQCRKEPYAWPGGYAIRPILEDGSMLCRMCIDEPEVHEGGEADGWRVEGFMIYWEGPDEFCAHCGDPISSEYGDPNSEGDD